MTFITRPKGNEPVAHSKATLPRGLSSRRSLRYSLHSQNRLKMNPIRPQLMTVADMLAEMQTRRPDSTSQLRWERDEVGQIVRIKQNKADSTYS